ncbi:MULTISPECIES: flagellin [Bacillaceae]|uniref:Flagellin n=1 Tax=Evansella alkalicola TaxID=745819 RepID=A0ABS6JUQ3_9BACI|nr:MULTISPECIES: flagellin [Bacillaceae]MBU9722284.1 flagellin [Bacillus alkalicola]
MRIISGSLPSLLNNNMKKTQNSLQKNMKSLSSGKRINSASDDAAGLAISQRMRALIRGSEQASRNVQDASSLMQVAEGGVEEISHVLQRMRELSVQAANDTMTTPDKLLIQDEIEELKKGLQELVSSTEFNGKKLLSNKEPAEYVYENRIASRNTELQVKELENPVLTNASNVGSKELRQQSKPNMVHTVERSINPAVIHSGYITDLESITKGTVVNHEPQWTQDGSAILFQRDGESYVVSISGDTTPTRVTSEESYPQKTETDDGLMRLRLSDDDSMLILEKRDGIESTDWTEIESFKYYKPDGTNGFSFSPVVDDDGQTFFVYTDNVGNLQKVDILDQEVVNITSLISNNNEVVTLDKTLDLYRMDDPDRPSIKVEKVSSDGIRRTLEYWNGEGDSPSDGYYTVSGDTFTFHGDAVIGAEDGDSYESSYQISFTSLNSAESNFSTVSIPTGAKVYNMNGQGEPQSLIISVGDTVVEKEYLLSERPEAGSVIDGVFVDEEQGNVELYGKWRPAYDEQVSFEYLNNSSFDDGAYSFGLVEYIDTYNLETDDLSNNRSLRVYVGDTELHHDENNGFTYNEENGKISLHGDARPNIHNVEQIRVEYIKDESTNTTTNEVFGIPLNSFRPEIYNLGEEDSPSSIQVIRNGSEEIVFSDENGFTYNIETNTILLHGTARPDINDSYTINMIVPHTTAFAQDGLVEIELSRTPQTYSVDESGNPGTFLVIVDGEEVQYDSEKENGFYYNSVTNRIELYGDARPDVATSRQPDVQVYYVFESQQLSGGETYDFQLDNDTLYYGLNQEDGPKGIRVYYNDEDVPYNSENGFTYNPETNILSLHGSYRPKNSDGEGDYEIFYVREPFLEMGIPESTYIHKVEVNGVDIGDNYYHDEEESIVRVIGDGKPDATRTLENVGLTVYYRESTDVFLDTEPTDSQVINELAQRGNRILASVIDEPELQVTLNGERLNTSQFTLTDQVISLNDREVDLSLNTTNYINVEYGVKHITEYKPNEFTFQVGANAGQTYDVQIRSFDNMLYDTDKIDVRSRESAVNSIGIIDDALSFAIRERSNMGAIQNRLSSIESTLGAVQENTTASVSRIEDVDMAREVMDMLKNNVLMQAQQSMNVHVHQRSSDVLALFN